MSNSDPPPIPKGSEPEPESGSLRLSRSGSSPEEKPKGRSAMPPTVLIGGTSCGSAGHALSEPPPAPAKAPANAHPARTFTVVAVNRRILTLLVALVPILAFGVLLSLVTVPYVSLGPGPTFNTLGEVDGKQVVDIEGADLHPTSGHLNMTTVSQRDALTLGQSLVLWASGREQLVPRDLVYPPDKSKDEIDKANTTDFKQSEDSAEYAALGYLKYPSAVTVETVSDSGPSAGKAKPGDPVDAAHGKTVANRDDITRRLKTTKTRDYPVVDYRW